MVWLDYKLNSMTYISPVIVMLYYLSIAKDDYSTSIFLVSIKYMSKQ